MEEIWKSIENFSNYEVSNLGNVRSLDRLIIKNNKVKFIKGKILKKRLSWNKNYYSVSIKDDNGKYCNRMIHRLVAKVFIPNPKNYEIVNHIDENKFNNNVNNLEWTTLEQNTLYSYYKHPERKQTVRILQYTLEGNFVKEWNSLKEASEFLNTNEENISECLKGYSKSSCKYIWKYYSSNYPLKIEKYSKNSKYRKVIQYDLFGNFIKVWDSMIDVEEQLNIKIHGINNCCKGVLNCSGKYVWRYYEDNFSRKIETKFKRIIQYDLNGNLLKIFNSAYEAALSLNKSSSQGIITGCCKGRVKTAFGFKWRYEE